MGPGLFFSERPKATQAQAEAGADDTTVMTPLRVAQAITALGGGGGGSGLPTWTFSAAGGDPTAGQFKANNANPNNTTSITIAGTSAGGGTGFDVSLGALNPTLALSYSIIFTNTTTGQQNRFVVSAAADSGTFATLTVTAFPTTETSWSGTYSVQYFFAPFTQLVVSVNGATADGNGAVVLNAFSGSGLTSVDVTNGAVTAGT